MKKITLTPIYILMAIFYCTSCNELQSIAEQPKTVRAYAPEMNNMEMLSMEQLPGWQLLAGTQWMGTTYCNSIKGVNEKLNASFYIDFNRGYMHTSMVKSGTTNGKTIFLDYMSAPDYLDFVFHRQFPNVKNAKRTMLKTFDQYSETERQEMEEMRVNLYNTCVQYNNQSANAAISHIRKVTIDRAAADYKWVQDGDTIIHTMEVLMNASYTDNTYSQSLKSSHISWGQNWLLTATAPKKNAEKASEDILKMFPTIKYNDEYIAACNNITMEGMRRNDAESRRIIGEMAQAEVRHQQDMMRTIQETNDYVYKTQQEVFANRQAAQERVNQGWRDAVVGVDRYMGTDGKVVEVPVSMGHQVWQNAEGGTIYTSDSYLFNAVDNLPDKDGIVREFRQLQLLK